MSYPDGLWFACPAPGADPQFYKRGDNTVRVTFEPKRFKCKKSRCGREGLGKC